MSGEGRVGRCVGRCVGMNEQGAPALDPAVVSLGIGIIRGLAGARAVERGPPAPGGRR